MITINSKPEECINSIECFKIDLTTDSYLQTVAVVGTLTFKPQLNPSVGETISLSINGLTETFTFVSGIPLPPNQIAIGATLSDTITIIKDFLLSHYVMQFFTEVLVINTVGFGDFVQINWENDNIIKLDISDANNVGASLFPATQYQPNVLKEDYSITATVVSDGKVEFSTSDIYIDVEQNGCLNLSGFLKSYLETPLPDVSTQYTLMDSYSKNFALWFNERSDNTQLYRQGAGDFRVIKSYEDVECNDFINKYDQYGNTLGINTYEFCSKDLMWLYFVREEGFNSNFRIQFSTFFGAVATINVPNSANTNVIAINISADFLESAGIYNPATMTGLFVGVDSGNGYGSFAGFRYNDINIGSGDIQEDNCCNTEQLLFLTKRGIFESVRLGVVSKTSRVKKYIYSTNENCVAEKRTCNVDIANTFQFVSKKIKGKSLEMELLKEMQASKQIYWVIDGEPVRLTDTGSTLKINYTKSNEISFKLNSAQIEQY